MCKHSVNKIIRTHPAKAKSNAFLMWDDGISLSGDDIPERYGVFRLGYDYILKGYGVFRLGYNRILKGYGVFRLGYDRNLKGYRVFQFGYDHILKGYRVFQLGYDHILKRESHSRNLNNYSSVQRRFS